MSRYDRESVNLLEEIRDRQPTGSSFSSGIYETAATQTITTGGTSQEVFPAVSVGNRHRLTLINTSDTIMYLNYGAVATTTDIPLFPDSGTVIDDSIASAKMTNQSVNLLCATTGKTFVAKQIIGD